MKIHEMQVGQYISARLVLADASVRQTKSIPPKDFLSMTFTDGTDTLDGKIWNYNAKLGAPETNKVYDVTGTIGEYAGKKQVTVAAHTISANQNMTEFSIVYCEDSEDLWNELYGLVNDIKDPRLLNITKEIYEGLKPLILESSSAKAVHHVGIGGNAMHTIEVTRIATMTAMTIQSFNDRLLCIDLILAGALLHDIGKLFTYKVNGPVVEVTEPGHLLDHITLGILIIRSAVEKLGREYIDVGDLLIHIIASHHGQLEYGSPVTPKFAEAYLVNMADGISASLDTLYAANDKAEREGKPMTDKLFTLSNREHLLQRTIWEKVTGGKRNEEV